MTPSWWEEGAPVSDEVGRTGRLAMSSKGLAVKLDSDSNEHVYVVDPNPEEWRLQVHQGLNAPQLRRLLYDCDRAIAHAFGCSYVPDYNMLADSVRGNSARLVANVVGRPELDGLRALVRGLLREGLAGYVR